MIGRTGTTPPLSPLIVFGEDWGRHPSSTQHLVRRLMVDRDVVWVNSMGMRRPRIGDAARVFKKLKAMAVPAGGRDLSASDRPPAVLSPKAISWPGSSLAGRVNRWSVGRQIRQRMAQLQIERPIFWTSLPTAVDVVGELGEVAVVYYAGDDFSALAGVDHEPVARMEERLISRADLVLAASPQIAARFPSKKAVVVPHGVDHSLFSSPTAPADEIVTRNGKPIAGFYGSLDEWFDTELVTKLAGRMPDWHFMLIGKVKTDLSSLGALPNVEILGPRAHSNLPRYAQHWQASLLPFRDTAQIRACNPLKLREYLAAGRPVISTRYPAAETYHDVVNLADGCAGFEAALRHSVKDTSEAVSKRRARVSLETWECRAETVHKLLLALQNGNRVSF